MKNFLKILCVIVIVFSANFASAQARYNKGDFLLNAGIGLGYYYAGGVPLLLSGEWAVNDVITVGPYLGYTSYRYNYGFFGSRYNYRYTFLDIGVRGSYHFSELFEIRNEKVDVYGGAFLGFLVSSYSGDDLTGYNDPYSGGLRLGIHVGARYFFSEKVAGYGELGYGIAPLSLGVTFKI
jgi:hypothetical protein